MIQAAKKAEEEKKAQFLKEVTQAEERARRAQNRSPQPPLFTGVTEPPPPNDTQNDNTQIDLTQTDEVASRQQVPVFTVSTTKVVKMDKDGIQVISDGSEGDSESSETEGVRSGDKEKRKKAEPKKKSKKRKSAKGKEKKVDSSSSSSDEDDQLDQLEDYGGLINKKFSVPKSAKKLVDSTSKNEADKSSDSIMVRLVDAVERGSLATVKKLSAELVEAEKVKDRVRGEKVKDKKAVKEKRRRDQEDSLKEKSKKKRKTYRKDPHKKESSDSSSSPSSDSSSYKGKRPKSSSSDSSSSSISKRSSRSSKTSGDSNSSASSLEASDSDYLVSKSGVNCQLKKASAFDLPDLPEKWQRAFRKMNKYVPLSVFKRSYIDDQNCSKDPFAKKSKRQWWEVSERDLERQMSYGEFILACDLEARYAKELYGHKAYAKYIKEHKEIVSNLMIKHKCWMVGLRYHLAIRNVIFRNRSQIIYEKGRKGKKGRKLEKVVLPEGLQEEAVTTARWEADAAGDLMFEENPYAHGRPKFGFDFYTGQRKENSKHRDLSWKHASGLGGGSGFDFKRPRGGNRGRGSGGFDHDQNKYSNGGTGSYHNWHTPQAGPLNSGWVAQGQQHAYRQVAAAKGGKHHKGGKKNN